MASTGTSKSGSRITQLAANTKALEYKEGYYASKVFQKFTAADKEQQLQEALTLGDPLNDLPLALEADYFRVAQNRYFVPISVKIPGSEVALAKKGKACKPPTLISSVW